MQPMSTGPWQQESLLHLGAEAAVHAGTWMGEAAVLKVRRNRTWRHPELDARLRRSRLSAEVRLMRRLYDAGLPVPRLLAADASAGWIVSTRLAGGPLFEALRSGAVPADILGEVGAKIREMHALGIVHGDLTTHNLLWDAEDGLSIIDLGLSRIVEDVEPFGLDLQVLAECLSASHPSIDDGIERVIEGYLGAEAGEARSTSGALLPAADVVVTRFRQIASRVRYHG